jgi:hypothetical protein|tara:strand:- start:1995 stop:2153 length:159 start_codon:yes stop_codon:yes gene_type:complete
MYKQVAVKGYFRKDGTWVGEHTRRIKATNKIIVSTPKKSKNNNPNQLRFNFE